MTSCARLVMLINYKRKLLRASPGNEKRQDASRTLTGGLDSPAGHRPKEACFRVSRSRSKQETSNPYVTDARSSRLSAGGLDDILEIQERLVRCHRFTAVDSGEKLLGNRSSCSPDKLADTVVHIHDLRLWHRGDHLVDSTKNVLRRRARHRLHEQIRIPVN